MRRGPRDFAWMGKPTTVDVVGVFGHDMGDMWIENTSGNQFLIHC